MHGYVTLCLLVGITRLKYIYFSSKSTILLTLHTGIKLFPQSFYQELQLYVKYELIYNHINPTRVSL